MVYDELEAERAERLLTSARFKSSTITKISAQSEGFCSFSPHKCLVSVS